ncbi:MAG TPA: DUF2252 family protein [Iamia sp.]|nr:DUF2252 family protein [Iamia sp.]
MAAVLPAHADRADAFRRYAELRAAGEVETAPHLLGPRARRHHVRNTLIEDHAVRLLDTPEAVATKFGILADSPFSFFRGTALLYYRDHAGVDGHLPAVFCIGDVHPENFGIMPSAGGHPFFAPNDFDEAWIAPFTYDTGRGAVGFWMAAREQGLSRKARRAVVRAFVEGYLAGLVDFAADDSEHTHQITEDTAPAVLEKAFAKAGRARADFLAKRIDLDAHRFLPEARIEPRNDLVAVLQPVVDAYAASLAEAGAPVRPEGFFRVHDVALRHGGGTASQGLARFWVLLDGPGPDAADHVIIELKMARRSALYGLVPATTFDARTSAERIALAHREFLVDGDPLYGAAEIEGRSFVVRERSPMKVNISVAGFGAADLIEYADVCGRALAQTHARSESHLVDVGVEGPGAEIGILRVVQPEVFVADTLEWAEEGGERVLADHQLFCQDLERGAFDAPGGLLAAES